MADSHPVTWANFLADPQTALNAVYSGLTLIIAAAAIAQLVIFRHFTQRQIRAYLHADTISLSDGSTAAPLFPNRANTPWVYIEVKNSGATPAYDVIHWAKTEVRLSSEESLLIAPARLSETSKTHMPREGRISKGIWYDRALSNQEIFRNKSRQPDYLRLRRG